MQKIYENFHIFHFQKRIVSAETIRGNTVNVKSVCNDMSIQILGGDSKIKCNMAEIEFKFLEIF